MNSLGAYRAISRLALATSQDVSVYDSLAEIAGGLKLIAERDIATCAAQAMREADALQLRFLNLIENEEVSK